MFGADDERSLSFGGSSSASGVLSVMAESVVICFCCFISPPFFSSRESVKKTGNDAQRTRQKCVFGCARARHSNLNVVVCKCCAHVREERKKYQPTCRLLVGGQCPMKLSLSYFVCARSEVLNTYIFVHEYIYIWHNAHKRPSAYNITNKPFSGIKHCFLARLFPLEGERADTRSQKVDTFFFCVWEWSKVEICPFKREIYY